MKRLYFIIAVFLGNVLFFSVFAQSRIITVHTKDSQVIERYVADIDSITFRTGTIITVPVNWVYEGTYCSTSETEYVAPTEGLAVNWAFDKYVNEDDPLQIKWEKNSEKDGQCRMPYTPTFKYTNIIDGGWDDFQVCKGKLYTTSTLFGILEYQNGSWVNAPNVPGGVSPIIREYNGKIYILCQNQIYIEKEDNSGYSLIFWGEDDMTGVLGGTANAFFAGAGTYYAGIFKYNGLTFDRVYENGTWYSLETAGNNVFFGAGGTHVQYKNYGVVYWSQSENKICETNLDIGVYKLASYKNIIFATGHTDAGMQGTYRFNGSAFDKISDIEGVLKTTGNTLYFLSASKVFKYNDTTGAFEEFHSNNAGNTYTEIEEHDGFLYLFGSNYVEAFHVGTNTWLQVEVDAPLVPVGIARSTEFGLFVSNANHSYGAIRRMEPKY